MSTVTDALPISKKDLLNLMNAFIPKGMIAWFALDEAPEGWEVYTPLLGKYPVGANANIGNTVEAGLPNIEASIGDGNGLSKGGVFIVEDTQSTGAFSNTLELKTVGLGPGASYGFNQLSFDASKSNVIYGNSTTVTPPSVKLLPCVKL